MTDLIIIIVAFALVVFGVYKKGGFKHLKGIWPSIWADFKEGRIKQRRWHLHIPIGIALGALLQFGFSFIFGTTHWIGQILISTFVGLWIAIAWEYYQGLRGANSTTAEVFESNKDVAVTTVSVLLGVIIVLAVL